MKLNCLEYVEKLRSQYDLTEEANMDIILIGHNPASELYVKSKLKECEKWNIKATVHRFESNAKTYEIMDAMDKIVDNPLTDGVMMQLPVDHPDANIIELHMKVLMTTFGNNRKDVDGMYNQTYNMCTPEGIFKYAQYLFPNNPTFDGLDVVILGRGKTVGAELIQMFLKTDCTLSLINSHTPEYSKVNKVVEADLVISAVGNPGVIDPYWVNDYAVVIDAGISRIDGKQVGDFSHEGVEEYPSMDYTPWTNGVGKITVATLCSHVRESRAKRK